MKKKLLLTFLLATFNFLNAQETPTPQPEKLIKLEKFDIQKQSLPNSKQIWTKLVCTFSTTKDWLDGASFNYYVLLEGQGENKKYRIIEGGVSYSNVPQGEPVLVSIKTFQGDEESDSLDWNGGGSKNTEKDWIRKYPRFNGILLNVRSTPWLLIDYNETPDLMAY